MEPVTIYHNPRCTKSRETLALLQEKGITPIVIEYLKTPLNYKELTELKAHFALKDFVRTSESVFKALGLDLKQESEVLQAMAKEPILMQRPIVTHKNKAVIARPPERVLELLSLSA